MAARSHQGTPAPTLADWQRIWELWDAATLDMIPRDDVAAKPLQLRHPFIFYFGHLPAFTDARLSHVLQQQLTEPSDFAVVFARGIDPDLEDPSKCHSHSPVPDQWPPLSAISQYRDNVRARIMQLYKQYSSYSTTNSVISTSRSVSDLAAMGARTAVGPVATMPPDVHQVLWMCFEHEAMHLETFMYMLVQYDKVLPPPAHLTEHKSAGDNCWCYHQQQQTGGDDTQADIKQLAKACKAHHTVRNSTSASELLSVPAAATWVQLPAGNVMLGFNTSPTGDRFNYSVAAAAAAAAAVDLAPAGPEDEPDSQISAAGSGADGLCMFGWDNESPARSVYVESCLMQHRPVCLLEYLAFLAQQVVDNIKQGPQQQQQQHQRESHQQLLIEGTPSPASTTHLLISNGCVAEQCFGHVVVEMLGPGGVLHHLVPLSVRVAQPIAAAAGDTFGPSADLVNEKIGSSLPHWDKGDTAAAASGGSDGSAATRTPNEVPKAATVFKLLQQLVSVRTVFGSVAISAAGHWPVYCSALQAAEYVIWWDRIDSSSSSSSSKLPSEAELVLAQQYNADCLAAAGTDSSGDMSAGTRSVDYQVWHPIAVQLEPDVLATGYSPATNTSAAAAAPAPARMIGHRNGRTDLPQPVNGNCHYQQQQGEPKCCLVSQLYENGWEWSSTILAEHAGFKPHPLYPEYSVDFFDGKHHVLLGGSWATLRSIVDRVTFRNFYQAGQQHVFSKFRLCRPVG